MYAFARLKNVSHASCSLATPEEYCAADFSVSTEISISFKSASLLKAMTVPKRTMKGVKGEKR